MTRHKTSPPTEAGVALKISDRFDMTGSGDYGVVYPNYKVNKIRGEPQYPLVDARDST
jgi:hypothetical protein